MSRLPFCVAKGVPDVTGNKLRRTIKGRNACPNGTRVSAIRTCVRPLELRYLVSRVLHNKLYRIII